MTSIGVSEIIIDACNPVHSFGKKVFPLSVLDRLVDGTIAAHGVDRCLSIELTQQGGSKQVISDLKD